MSFQAYLDNIKANTGKTPEDFKSQLEKEKIAGSRDEGVGSCSMVKG